MAMGHDDGEQPTLFLTYDKLRGLGHPFYDALDRLLREQGFDRFVEGLCEPFYAEVMGPIVMATTARPVKGTSRCLKLSSRGLSPSSQSSHR